MANTEIPNRISALDKAEIWERVMETGRHVERLKGTNVVKSG